jgi:hypothetical protein
MDYSIIIYFLAIFIRITITLEYNHDDDDEKQIVSQSCTYLFIFNCLITPYSSYQMNCFQ